MLENMNLEFMRIRLHGEDSSIFFLRERDDEEGFEPLLEVETWFAVTRQRDTASAYVDKLTIKLDSDEKLSAFRDADRFDLRIAERRVRYALEQKSEALQSVASFGFANVRLTTNEDSAIVED